MTAPTLPWVKEICFWFDTLRPQQCIDTVTSHVTSVEEPCRVVLAARLQDNGHAVILEEGVFLSVMDMGRGPRAIWETVFHNFEIRFDQAVCMGNPEHLFTLDTFAAKVEELRQALGGTVFAGKDGISILCQEWPVVKPST